MRPGSSCERGVTPVPVRHCHFRRFSPPETQCSSGVSASSRVCFERVNPPADLTQGFRQRATCREAAGERGGAIPLRSLDRDDRSDPPAPKGPAAASLTIRDGASRKTGSPRCGRRRGKRRHAAPRTDRRRPDPRHVGGARRCLHPGRRAQEPADDRFHNDGVPVTFTFSTCTGLLGGSGSNFVGLRLPRLVQRSTVTPTSSSCPATTPPSRIDRPRHCGPGRSGARVAGRHGQHRTLVRGRLRRARHPVGSPGSCSSACVSGAAAQARRDAQGR